MPAAWPSAIRPAQAPKKKPSQSVISMRRSAELSVLLAAVLRPGAGMTIPRISAAATAPQANSVAPVHTSVAQGPIASIIARNASAATTEPSAPEPAVSPAARPRRCGRTVTFACSAML